MDEEWWAGPGDYNGANCKNCGRERVLVVEAPNGDDRATCEKCGWDQAADCYASELYFPVVLPGYRILPPGQLDPETLEAATNVAYRQGQVDWEDGDGGRYGHGYENACEEITEAIRALQHKDKGDG